MENVYVYKKKGSKSSKIVILESKCDFTDFDKEFEDFLINRTWGGRGKDPAGWYFVKMLKIP